MFYHLENDMRRKTCFPTDPCPSTSRLPGLSPQTDLFCSSWFRASGRSEEPEGDRPHHDVSECRLGPGWWSCSPLQGLLCALGWWARRDGAMFFIFFLWEGLTDETRWFMNFPSKMDPQEQVPAGTTSIVLRNLQPDTKYMVSVLPVYPAREGRRQSEEGKTCKLLRDRKVFIRFVPEMLTDSMFFCSQCLWVASAAWRWPTQPSPPSLWTGTQLEATFRAIRSSTFPQTEAWRLW